MQRTIIVETCCEVIMKILTKRCLNCRKINKVSTVFIRFFISGIQLIVLSRISSKMTNETEVFEISCIIISKNAQTSFTSFFIYFSVTPNSIYNF